MRALGRKGVRLGRKVLECVAGEILPGTNLGGFALFAVTWSPLLAIEKQFPAVAEWQWTLVGAVVCLVFDVGVRKILTHESLLEYRRGARVFFLPAWLMGLLWMLVGSIQAVCALWKCP